MGASTSWNPLGLFRPVMGMLYLFLPPHLHLYLPNYIMSHLITQIFSVAEGCIKLYSWRVKSSLFLLIINYYGQKKSSPYWPLFNRRGKRVFRQSSFPTDCPSAHLSLLHLSASVNTLPHWTDLNKTLILGTSMKIYREIPTWNKIEQKIGHFISLR